MIVATNEETLSAKEAMKIFKQDMAERHTKQHNSSKVFKGRDLGQEWNVPKEELEKIIQHNTQNGFKWIPEIGRFVHVSDKVIIREKSVSINGRSVTMAKYTKSRGGRGVSRRSRNAVTFE